MEMIYNISMSEKGPNQNNPGPDKSVLNSIRNQKIKDTMLNIDKSIVDLWDERENLSVEIESHANYLREKYPNIENYRVFHVFSGSTVRSKHLNLIEDDLPGDDSIEKFVDYLANKYIKG